MKGHDRIGFNHGVLGLVENPALGPGFFRQNTSDYALGVLTPKAGPSGWVFSQAQHPLIKTYNSIVTRPNSLSWWWWPFYWNTIGYPSWYDNDIVWLRDTVHRTSQWELVQASLVRTRNDVFLFLSRDVKCRLTGPTQDFRHLYFLM